MLAIGKTLAIGKMLAIGKILAEMRKHPGWKRRTRYNVQPSSTRELALFGFHSTHNARARVARSEALRRAWVLLAETRRRSARLAFKELDAGRLGGRNGKTGRLQKACPRIDSEREDRIALLIFGQEKTAIGRDAEVARDLAQRIEIFDATNPSAVRVDSEQCDRIGTSVASIYESPRRMDQYFGS